MKKKILLALVVALVTPVLADTYTIDVGILGNTTTYETYPGDIYVFLYDWFNTQKIVTISAHDAPLDIDRLLSPGEVYINPDLNFTVTCSYCQDVNMTLICEAPICDYSGNLTSEAQCLAWEEQNADLKGMIGFKDEQINKTLDELADLVNINGNVTTQLSDLQATTTFQCQRCKADGSREAMNFVLGIGGVISLVITLFAALIWILAKKGLLKTNYFKDTFIVNIYNLLKPVTEKISYDAQIGPVGKGGYEIDGKPIPEEDIIADYKDANQRTVVIGGRETQKEIGMKVAELTRDNKVLKADNKKLRTENELYKKRAVDEMMPDTGPKK